MNLLIAEDNNRMRSMIKDLIKDSFITIYECDNGADAIRNYNEHKPEWILMDIRMNGMDGFTASEIILHDYPAANILIVSSFHEEEYINKSKSIGVKGYVLKENLYEILNYIK